MPKEEAAELAARIVRMQSSKNPGDQFHIDKDGKRHANFIPDDPNQPGVAHLWMGPKAGYRSFYSGPNVMDDKPVSEPSPIGTAQGAEPEAAPSDSSQMNQD